MSKDFSLSKVAPASIKVVGVGSAGCRAVKYRLATNLWDVDCVMIDSDSRMLHQSPCSKTIHVGKYTKPRPFCTATPEWGRKAAKDDTHMIRKVLEGSDPIFLVACMGGAVGSGATSVLARICEEMGALTIGIITRPFPFEGKRRLENAQKGLNEIERIADITLLIPYDDVLKTVSTKTTLLEVYKVADEIIACGVNGFLGLIRSGEKTLLDGDFEYLRPFLAECGQAFLGIGMADKLALAMEKAIYCPLLVDGALEKAQKVIINVTASEQTTQYELDVALDLLQERLSKNTEILWALTGFKDEPMVILYATSLG